MKDIIEKGVKEHESNRFRINALDPNSKEYFVKGVVDNLRKEGLNGDELFEKAAKQLSGGRWVTIDGRHVYIKDGKVAVGTVYGKDGEKVTAGEKVASGGSKGSSKEEDLGFKKELIGDDKKKEGSKKGDVKPTKEQINEAMSLPNSDGSKLASYVTFDMLNDSQKKRVSDKAKEIAENPFYTTKFVNGKRTSHDAKGRIYFKSRQDADEFSKNNRTENISYFVEENPLYNGKGGDKPETSNQKEIERLEKRNEFLSSQKNSTPSSRMELKRNNAKINKLKENTSKVYGGEEKQTKKQENYLSDLSHSAKEVYNKFLTSGKKEYVSDLVEGDTTKGMWNKGVNELIKNGIAEVVKNENGFRTVKLKQNKSDKLDSGAKKLMGHLLLSSNKFKDINKVSVESTPKGNWALYYDGKAVSTIGGDQLSEDTIKKYNLEHHG